MDFLARVTIYISLTMGICIFTMFTLFAIPNLIDRYEDIWDDYQRSLEPELDDTWHSGIGGFPEKIPFADICTYSMKAHLLTYSAISNHVDDELIIATAGLPPGVDRDDFQNCMEQTTFTMSRMNMVIPDLINEKNDWLDVKINFDEYSYSDNESGIIRIVDRNMNWESEAVDNFSVKVWSDLDVDGISLTVTETDEATGIFEGHIFFSTDEESSGARLAVMEGDTVTVQHSEIKATAIIRNP